MKKLDLAFDAMDQTLKRIETMLAGMIRSEIAMNDALWKMLERIKALEEIVLNGEKNDN